MARWVVWHWVRRGDAGMQVVVVGEVEGPDKRAAERRAVMRYGGGYQVQSRVSFDLSAEEAAAVRRNDSLNLRG